MKAVVRIVVALLATGRLQRIVLAVGIVLTAAGAATVTFASPAVPLLLAGSLLLLMPPTLATGAMFSALSVPRSFLLLPHFRRRMLTALLLAQALTAGAIVGAISLAPGSPAPIDVAASSVALLTLFSLMWMLPPLFAGSALLLLGPAVGGIGELAERYPPLAEPGTAAALTLASSAAVWLAFGRRYLRGAPVSSLLNFTTNVWGSALGSGGALPPPPSLERFHDWQVDVSAPSLTRCGRRVVLTGRLPTRGVRWIVGLVPLMLILVLLFAVVDIDGNIGEFPWVAFMIATAPFVGFLFAQQAARRARRLWLVAGSRSRLYGACEHELWRPALLGAAASLALIIGGVTLWFGGSWPLAALAAALTAGGFVFAYYLGLMLIDGVRVADVAAGILLTAGTAYGAWRLFGTDDGRTAAIAVVTLHIVAAVACRAVGRYRWHTIDWIRFRPSKVPAQMLRAWTAERRS